MVHQLRQLWKLIEGVFWVPLGIPGWNNSTKIMDFALLRVEFDMA
jgi:hypothetical protein